MCLPFLRVWGKSRLVGACALSNSGEGPSGVPVGASWPGPLILTGMQAAAVALARIPARGLSSGRIWPHTRGLSESYFLQAIPDL